MVRTAAELHPARSYIRAFWSSLPFPVLPSQSRARVPKPDGCPVYTITPYLPVASVSLPHRTEQTWQSIAGFCSYTCPPSTGGSRLPFSSWTASFCRASPGSSRPCPPPTPLPHVLTNCWMLMTSMVPPALHAPSERSRAAQPFYRRATSWGQGSQGLVPGQIAQWFCNTDQNTSVGVQPAADRSRWSRVRCMLRHPLSGTCAIPCTCAGVMGPGMPGPLEKS